jgi:hypothetical protein
VSSDEISNSLYQFFWVASIVRGRVLFQAETEHCGDHAWPAGRQRSGMAVAYEENLDNGDPLEEIVRLEEHIEELFCQD